MTSKNSFRILRKRFFISGLLVLAFLVFYTLSPRAVFANGFINFSTKEHSVNLDFSPTISKLNSLGRSITTTGEALQDKVSSTLSTLASLPALAASQTANIFTTFTDNLRDAWEAYTSSP